MIFQDVFQQHKTTVEYALTLQLQKQLHNFGKLTLKSVRSDSFVLKTVGCISVNIQPITTVKYLTKYYNLFLSLQHFSTQCNYFIGQLDPQYLR